LLFSVADGRFDRKIERFEGLCPVVKAPFAPLATPLAGGGAGITSGTVVNGITSGLAGMSSLGAPLTHREHAHGVVFVTGHAKPGDSGTDWAQLAATARQAKLTLVIYMGVSSLDHIRQGLLKGLPSHTPVAIVQHASLPQQREALTTLGEVVNTMAREGLQSPSIIVVGDVVQGARAWANHHPTEQPTALQA
jgi:uroporphyrin-III C-methyltransferase